MMMAVGLPDLVLGCFRPRVRSCFLSDTLPEAQLDPRSPDAEVPFHHWSSRELAREILQPPEAGHLAVCNICSSDPYVVIKMAKQRNNSQIPDFALELKCLRNNLCRTSKREAHKNTILTAPVLLLTISASHSEILVHSSSTKTSCVTLNF
ncbi:hypothetical protein I3760_16G031700 [Carya illinoinensis]|nr:hypothetical protein I3760_16G031700 [Carya illinoinensis]